MTQHISLTIAIITTVIIVMAFSIWIRKKSGAIVIPNGNTGRKRWTLSPQMIRKFFAVYGTALFSLIGTLLAFRAQLFKTNTGVMSPILISLHIVLIAVQGAILLFLFRSRSKPNRGDTT